MMIDLGKPLNELLATVLRYWTNRVGPYLCADVVKGRWADNRKADQKYIGLGI
jgi:hypothetical protein